jgi:hypothetical protein
VSMLHSYLFYHHLLCIASGSCGRA